jgi:hypothetical protein
MRPKRNIYWYVYAESCWWCQGEWYTEPVEGSSNMARAKTRKGARRLAARCPSTQVYLFKRDLRGYTKEWILTK